MAEKVTVTIDIDLTALSNHDDQHLAALWHIAQANPADGFTDPAAGRAAEVIGREIIRRWLATVEPELWNHQGQHHYWNQLRHLGSWQNGVFLPHTATSQERQQLLRSAGPSASRDGDGRYDH